MNFDAREGSDRALQRVRLATIALSVAVPALLLVAAWFHPHLPPSALTRDPLAVVDGIVARGGPCCSRFTGAISTAGVMLWSATAAVTFFAALVLTSVGAPRPQVVLMALAGGLSTWLLADDAFMLHEGYSPKLAGFSVFNFIPIIAMVPILAAIVRAEVRTDLPILVAALAALAMSLVVDDVVRGGSTKIFIEDAFKFFGLSLWTAFFALTAMRFVLMAAASPRPAEPRRR